MSPSLPLLPINKRNQLNTSFDLCAAAVYEDCAEVARWLVSEGSGIFDLLKMRYSFSKTFNLLPTIWRSIPILSVFHSAAVPWISTVKDHWRLWGFQLPRPPSSSASISLHLFKNQTFVQVFNLLLTKWGTVPIPSLILFSFISNFFFFSFVLFHFGAVVTDMSILKVGPHSWTDDPAEQVVQPVTIE